MKILIVEGSDFEGFPPGGIKFYVTNYIKESGLNVNVKIVGITSNPSEKPGVWTFREIDGRKIPFLPVYYVNKKSGINNKPKMPIRIGTSIGIFRFRRVIYKESFDLVYIHLPELILPFLLSKSTKSKIAFHLHGTLRGAITGSRYKWLNRNIFAKLYELYSKLLLKNTKIIFTISHEGLSVINNLIRNYKGVLKWIPNMVDNNIFYNSNNKTDAREKFGFQKNDLLLVYTGRLEIGKQVEVLLNYIYRLKEQYKNIKLIIAGSGSDYQRLRNITLSLDLNKEVLFLGEIDHNELPSLLNCCDIYVFTSEAEGFPTSVLEAAACGLPILSNDVGDVNQVVIEGETGYLLRKKDFNDFDCKLKMILKNYDIMSLKAEKKAKEFSSENIVREINSIFLETIRAKVNV